MKHPRTWVVTADSARAHLFIYDDSTDQLRSGELAGLPPYGDRIQSHTTKSDRPGRSFGSAGGGVRHAIESHSDFRKLEKQRFCLTVAEAINRAASTRQFDRLVLVAPPRSLGELRKHLSDQVQSGMEVIARDLTKAPVEKIWDEVAESVRRRPPVQPM